MRGPTAHIDSFTRDNLQPQGQWPDLPRGTVGLLAVRSPTGCRYMADKRQAECVRHGWNLTGDHFHATGSEFRASMKAKPMKADLASEQTGKREIIKLG